MGTELCCIRENGLGKKAEVHATRTSNNAIPLGCIDRVVVLPWTAGKASVKSHLR
jgi:hypothetical protein